MRLGAAASVSNASRRGRECLRWRPDGALLRRSGFQARLELLELDLGLRGRRRGRRGEARLDGWGSDALLQSYGAERHPVFEETGEDFIAARIRMDRDFFRRYNPDRNKAEFEKAWKEEHQTTFAPRVFTYEPQYEGSPVIFGPEGGKSGAHGEHNFLARPGHHLPPQMLSSGNNLFEELSEGFTLLALDGEPATPAVFKAAAESLDIPLKIITDSRDGGRDEYQANLILIRPDQYVVWTGDNSPDDATKLMATVVGRG